jgi:hypothetical protein
MNAARNFHEFDEWRSWIEFLRVNTLREVAARWYCEGKFAAFNAASSQAS